jgi:PAS domain S-box-containing protein
MAAPVPFDAVARTGDEVPIELIVTTVDGEDEPLLLATLRDVSLRVEAEKRAHVGERDYRDLFDGVPVGLYRTEPNGTILDANPALAEILGFSRPEDLIGRNARALFADPDDRSQQVDRLTSETTAINSDIRLRRVDGTVIWARDRTRAVRDHDGRVTIYEGALQDITEERLALEQLEQEIRAKADLIASVSHELRTPLTAVVGFIDVLRDGAALSGDERNEYLAHAAEQATELSLLIEDLLTSAHIEHDELVVVPAEVDVAASVATAKDAVARTRIGDVDLVVPDGLVAWADPTRVRQIVRNLIGNALIHGTPPVIVSASANADTIEVVVTDHGKGVAPEHGERIYESFFRGADAVTRPASIGLGLAVSRRLARLMGGDLSHRRVEGCTQFVLTLATRPASALPAGHPSVAALR